MNYIALLRGINVGGNRKVEMVKLKALFETLGYTNINTYINSGNVLFESIDSPLSIKEKIEFGIREEFGFHSPTLIKTLAEIIKIAKAIPVAWQNDAEQKTDVAYLFQDIDNKEIIDALPIKKEFLNLEYVEGALIWNVKRDNYHKSQLNKIVSAKLYQSMTVRNVNTARYLAGMVYKNT